NSIITQIKNQLYLYLYIILTELNIIFFFFSSRRRHTRSDRDCSSDVCSSDLVDDADDPAVIDHEIRYDRTLQSDHRDRKSTRLNSSHDQISYAVFCLKKKK